MESKIGVICILAGMLTLCSTTSYFVFLHFGVIGLLILIAVILIFIGCMLVNSAMIEDLRKMK